MKMHRELMRAFNEAKPLDAKASKVLHVFSDAMHFLEAHIIEYTANGLKVQASYPEDATIDVFDSEHLSPSDDESFQSHTLQDGRILYTFTLKDFGVMIALRKVSLDESTLEIFSELVFFSDRLFAESSQRLKSEALEKALKHERNLFRTIIDSIPDMIAFKDKEGIYQLTNKAVETYYKQSIVGKSIDDVYPEYEADIVRTLDYEVYKENKPTSKRLSMLVGEEYVFTDAIRAPVYDESGKPMGIVSIARSVGRSESASKDERQPHYVVIDAEDMNRQKRLEQTLRKREAFLRSLIDSTTDMIVRVDLQNRFTYVNDAYCKVFGKTKEELLGKSFTPLVHEDDLEATQKAMEKLFEPPYRAYMEQRAMTKDGWRWLAWEDAGVLDDNGDVVEITGVGRDITERKYAEQALEQNYAFQSTLVTLASKHLNVAPGKENQAIEEVLQRGVEAIDATHAYVVLKEKASPVYTINHYFYKNKNTQHTLYRDPITKLELEWIDAHKRDEVTVLKHVDKLPKRHKLRKRFKTTQSISAMALPLQISSYDYAAIVFESARAQETSSELGDYLLKVLAQIITNLLERKADAQAILDAKQSAEAANRAKSHFLASMSHEIRTPLNVIYNTVCLLKEAYKANVPVDYFAALESNLDMLNGIVTNIIDTTKIESKAIELQEEVFDLEESLYFVIKSQENIAVRKGLNVDFDYDYGIVDYVRTDRLRLNQIILNLVHNAIKFTDIGSVKLRVKVLEKTRNSWRVQFNVYDTGFGLDENEIHNIREKFYRTDSAKAQPGTGLGLTIVEELLNLFGSTLHIDSEKRKGSRFYFELDLVFDQAVSVNDKAIDGKRVLLIANADGAHIKKVLNALPINLSVIAPDDERLKEKVNHHESIVYYLEHYHEAALKSLNETMHLLPEHVHTILAIDSGVTPPPSVFELPFNDEIVGYVTKQRMSELLSQNPSVGSVDTKNKPTQEHHLLVVEDNTMARQTLERILRSSGYHVDSVSTAEQAFKNLEKTPYHLILMDIQLPGIDGVEAMKRIRSSAWKTHADVSIIALTAHALKEDVQRYKKAGMNDVITKPYNVSTLLASINKQLKTHYKETDPLFDEKAYNDNYKRYGALKSELINVFLNAVHKDTEAIRTALKRQDREAIKHAVHYFKGSCATIMATRAVKDAEVLLDNIQHAPFDEITRQGEKLLQTTQELIDYLKTKHE